MEIHYLKRVDSTHKHLLSLIKAQMIDSETAVVAQEQTAGIGSRGNEWLGEDGNLYLSFAQSLDDLPYDLSLGSASIYYSYVLKEVLSGYGSQVWIKWPNDFYIDAVKVGGTISTVFNRWLICSIGLNIKEAPHNFQKMDVDIEIRTLVQDFFNLLKKKQSWKQIFIKYRVEFNKSAPFVVHTDSGHLSLKDALLNDDGSLQIEGKRIYSRR